MNSVKINFGTQTGITAKLIAKGEAIPVSNTAFSGEYLETVFDYSAGVLYVGIGKDKKLSPMQLKEVGATITKKLITDKIYTFCIDDSSAKQGKYYYQNLAQGLALGAYKYSLKSKKEDKLNLVITLLGKEDQKAVDEGIILAGGVSVARTFTNLPASHLRPAGYADDIVSLLTPLGVECEILNDEKLKELGLNGLYLIGNSSEFPPRLVIMRYNNNAKKAKTALVGKGITFDTGGYNLKPGASMETMNGDMGGSASVVGAIYALAKAKAKVNIVGIAAIAENRVSPGSLVAGDVYTAYDGTTVEVLNTDAEGRLVLSEAVSYAIKNEKADEVLDIATLTGAAVRTFGDIVTPTVCNNDNMFDKIKDAGKKTGERYWMLPNFEEYDKKLESNVADIRNIGGAEGGTITGGLFVGRFAKKTPWIHLDIAGTSWSDKPLYAHLSKGATGVAVDSLYYFCQED